MKTRKRISALLLAVLLAASFSIPAFAEDPSEIPDPVPENTTVNENPSGNTVNENEGRITVNNGTVTNNAGRIGYQGENDTGNFGIVENNTGGVMQNYGTVDNNNNGSVFTNFGAVEENNGYIQTNASDRNDPDKHGTVTENNKTVDFNYGVVENNNSGAVVEKNHGTVENNNDGAKVSANYGEVTNNSGTVTTNEREIGDFSRGVVTNNSGTVMENCGEVTNNSGTVEENFADAVVTINSGTVELNEGTVTYNTGTVNRNNGTVEYNFGGNVSYGNVTNSFLGVTVTDENGLIKKPEGTNFFLDIPAEMIEELENRFLVKDENKDGQEILESPATVTVTSDKGSRLDKPKVDGNADYEISGSSSGWTISFFGLFSNIEINITGSKPAPASASSASVFAGTCRLKFDFDGGELDGRTELVKNCYAGQIIKLPGPLEKEGFEFAGWETEIRGKKIVFDAGEKYTVTSSKTFVALWVEE